MTQIAHDNGGFYRESLQRRIVGLCRRRLVFCFRWKRSCVDFTFSGRTCPALDPGEPTKHAPQSGAAKQGSLQRTKFMRRYATSKLRLALFVLLIGRRCWS